MHDRRCLAALQNFEPLISSHARWRHLAGGPVKYPEECPTKIVEIVLEACLCVPLDSAVPAWCVGAKVFATNRSLPMAPALCMGRVAGHRPSPTRECASARLLRGCSASAHQSAESPQGK